MIKDILPAALEQKIVQTIQQRCRLFIEAEKNNRKLYYEPYAVSRKKHNLTSVVLSGFALEKLISGKFIGSDSILVTFQIKVET